MDRKGKEGKKTGEKRGQKLEEKVRHLENKK